LEVSAAELSAVVRAQLLNDAHGLVHLGGVRVRASCRGRDLVVALQRPDGRTIAADERLVLVTNDFVATGGDELLDPIPRVGMRLLFDTDTTLRDLLATELAKSTRPLNPDDPALFDPARPRIA
jgi:hypothetical protein